LGSSAANRGPGRLELPHASGAILAGAVVFRVPHQNYRIDAPALYRSGVGCVLHADRADFEFLAVRLQDHPGVPRLRVADAAQVQVYSASDHRRIYGRKLPRTNPERRAHLGVSGDIDRNKSTS
jgi:hypothetical protein